MLFFPIFLILIVEGVIFTVSTTWDREWSCEIYEKRNVKKVSICTEQKCANCGTIPESCTMSQSSQTAYNLCLCKNGWRTLDGRCAAECSDAADPNDPRCTGYANTIFVTGDNPIELACGRCKAGDVSLYSTSCNPPCCCVYGYVRDRTGQCVDSGKCCQPPASPAGAGAGAQEPDQQEPAGVPYVGPEGVPYVGPDGVPYVGPDGVPYVGPDGVPYVGPDGVPYVGPEGVPEGGPEGVPYVGPEGVPYVGPDGVPYVGPEGGGRVVVDINVAP
ncbi:unnamed protein product [Plutella xylostella]|uniref:(diamondback moth) hypothetical protein n=1 Tax=Plutella xylostella TaxID=51655 RepID=A0A8S4F3B3_PLUXY|nr:unnamed protein product [Plutella xylostella]